MKDTSGLCTWRMVQEAPPRVKGADYLPLPWGSPCHLLGMLISCPPRAWICTVSGCQRLVHSVLPSYGTPGLQHYSLRGGFDTVFGFSLSQMTDVMSCLCAIFHYSHTPHVLSYYHRNTSCDSLLAHYNPSQGMMGMWTVFSCTISSTTA